MSSWQTQSFFACVSTHFLMRSFLLLVTCREEEWLWRKSPFHRHSDRIKQLCVFISQWLLAGKYLSIAIFLPIGILLSEGSEQEASYGPWNSLAKRNWAISVGILNGLGRGGAEKRKMDGLEDFRFAVEGVGLVRVRSNLTITSLFRQILYFPQTQMEPIISIDLDDKIIYDTFSVVVECWVSFWSDFQSGSRVLKKML